MKASNLVRVSLSAALGLSLALGLAGCAAASPEPAATVNGVEIAEDTVTAYVENFRTTSSLEDDVAWRQWLADNSYTPQSVREEVIDYYVDQELTRQAAQERGVSVDATKVNETVQKAKENYDSDEAWKQALESSNTTEEAYRNQVELSLLKEALAVSFDNTEDSLESSASSSAYNEWFTTFKEKAEITVNPLPEEVSYNKSAS